MLLEAPARSWEAKCRACGHWMATAPDGTAWQKSRCHDRRCREYGKPQKVWYTEQQKTRARV